VPFSTDRWGKEDSDTKLTVYVRTAHICDLNLFSVDLPEKAKILRLELTKSGRPHSRDAEKGYSLSDYLENYLPRLILAGNSV
jgi:hypothetical protein